jgi:hypothetical protein
VGFGVEGRCSVSLSMVLGHRFIALSQAISELPAFDRHCES